ncbi:MAG: class D beta-lactamase [Candidatus Omnitrophica bacterium]|nr:class D beta-lactamase [Candidatus Omnitrophota bacterium]
MSRTHHRFLLKILALLVVGLWSGVPAEALEWQDSPAMARAFEKSGAEGTFVLYDTKAQVFVGHNRERAGTRFIPASTFKIPNTLIGLAAGSVRDVDEILPYGGQPQPIAAWERDMSLRDAIPISNVPVYQELARRTGLEFMQSAVSKIDYGNNTVGTVVDRFWLDGPLKISAVEQTQFLARLAGADLPFPEEIQTAVRDIIQLEQQPGWTLYGKTGWGTKEEPAVGWWVGWINANGRIYTFALNMDLGDAADLPKRIELGRTCLRSYGLLKQ